MYSFATEYLTFPGRESVTLDHRSGATETIADACRSSNNVREESPSDGAYQRESLLWLLPSGEVSAEPQPGDMITDGYGKGFLIQGVGWPIFGSADLRRFRLEDLGHQVQYVRTTADSSNATARTVTETIGDPLACAIQPQSRILTDMFGMKTVPQTYAIWLYNGVGQPINPGDMFVDENGIRYEILEVSDRKRIDALSRFDCIKKL